LEKSQEQRFWIFSQNGKIDILLKRFWLNIWLILKKSRFIHFSLTYFFRKPHLAKKFSMFEKNFLQFFLIFFSVRSSIFFFFRFQYFKDEHFLFKSEQSRHFEGVQILCLRKSSEKSLGPTMTRRRKFFLFCLFGSLPHEKIPN